MTHPDAVQDWAEGLRRAQGLRVWSVAITVFGDIAHGRGRWITQQRMGAILQRVGIGPGATRTALSRLAADGWILREREGRTSVCRLSPKGVQTFDPASRLIYAVPGSLPTPVITLDPPQDGCIRLTSGAALVRPPGTGSVVGMSGLRLEPDRLAAMHNAPPFPQIDALIGRIAGLDEVQADPLSAVAARVLLIHAWRRIVLRYPEPPQALLPAGTPDPRTAVAKTYADLTAGVEAWCDAPFGSEGPMPADQSVHRFSKV